MRRPLLAFLRTVLVAACAACGGNEPAPATPPTQAPEPAAAMPTASSPAPSSTAPVMASSPPATPAPPAAAAVLPLGAHEHQDLLMAWVDAFNAHDVTRLAALYDGGRIARQREALWQLLPDARMNPVRVWPSMGSSAGLEWVLTGTDTKGIGGHPPSGKRVGVRALTIIWFGMRNQRVIGIDDTFFDMGTLAGQAAGASVRPVPVAPSAPSFDWFAGVTGDDQGLVQSWCDALVKGDASAIGAMVSDDFVWTDLTRNADVVGGPAMLAALAARRKEGLVITDALRKTIEVDIGWRSRRGALAEHAVVEVKGGKISALISYDRAPARP